jgi:hypothetical protein
LLEVGGVYGDNVTHERALFLNTSTGHDTRGCAALSNKLVGFEHARLSGRVLREILAENNTNMRVKLGPIRLIITTVVDLIGTYSTPFNADIVVEVAHLLRKSGSKSVFTSTGFTANEDDTLLRNKSVVTTFGLAVGKGLRYLVIEAEGMRKRGTVGGSKS